MENGDQNEFQTLSEKEDRLHPAGKDMVQEGDQSEKKSNSRLPLSVLPPRERGSAPRPIWKRSINNRKPVFQLSQSVQLLVGNLRVGEAKIIERQNNGTCKSLHGQKLYVSDGEYSKRS